MLFNSIEFLFAFLPLTLILTFAALKIGGRPLGMMVLTAASVFFYGWWEASSLLIIGGSIAVNYTIATAIARQSDGGARKVLLTAGVAVNLAALGYFKYANFFLESISAATGSSGPVLSIGLPLAISFYSFQQIAFLVDTYKGKVSRSPFRDYMLSVVFFPHLIAGPLLHYRDIITQFERRFSVNWTTISIGFPIFAVGLAKKVAIADPISVFVNPLFLKSTQGPLEFFEGWAAALGYTAQLYFDFSGYSDMAIGLGLMFGIALPLNFLSPYKSTSIIEFWRRWHITLSNFLRDYLYFPLGGSRVGVVRKYGNLLIVMLLGGLWHGAAWTFVFWGLLHGSYLVVNHLWRNNVGAHLGRANAMLAPVYAVMTFVLVVISWVFFKAVDFPSALNVLQGMFTPASIALPSEIPLVFNFAPWPRVTWGGGMSFADFTTFWFYAGVAYAIVWFAPNAAQIFDIDGKESPPSWIGPFNRPSAKIAATVGLVWISAFGVFGSVPSEFLYFKF